ncbi:hypothetical protein EDB83DRAFT_2318299 [Lactarius deliciosus]|nr:hypothetical protein EDB83DRAFT_2318299 [Lactarius deliciosus]
MVACKLQLNSHLPLFVFLTRLYNLLPFRYHHRQTYLRKYLASTMSPSIPGQTYLGVQINHLCRLERYATVLRRCDAVDAILAVFQAKPSISVVKDGNQRSMKWISLVVDVLYMFSGTLGGVADVAFSPPAGAIFTGRWKPPLAQNDMRQIRVPDVVRVARLLEHSMDANRIRSDQCRPLCVASYCGKLGVVQLLFERGTKVDVEAASKCAIPSHWGEYESREDGTHLARLLLERDLDVSA